MLGVEAGQYKDYATVSQKLPYELQLAGLVERWWHGIPMRCWVSWRYRGFREVVIDEALFF